MTDVAELKDAYRVALRKDVWLQEATSHLDDALHALTVADDSVASETLEHIRTASWVVRQRQTQATKERLEVLEALREYWEQETLKTLEKESGHD